MRFGNYIEFLITWRKPHHSVSIRLEMTREIRLLPHGENGGKMAFWIPSFSAICRFRQTTCTVSRYNEEMALESRRQTVGLVWIQCGLKFSWITMVPHEEDAMSMSALKEEQMVLLVWENIKPSYLQFCYECVPRRMKAVFDANRGYTKY